MAAESRKVEALGEEICAVRLSWHEGDDNLEALDHVANIKVATRDVLGLVVMLRVVGEIACSSIIGEQGSRPWHSGWINATEKLAKINDMLQMVREAHKTECTRQRWRERRR